MLKKNVLSLFTAIIILYLSLADSSNFEKIPAFSIPGLDKLVHFLMYSGLMSVIIFEHRKPFLNNKKLFLLAIIPFLYGILMEILQRYFTSNRSGSVYDALADIAGISAAMLLWFLVKDRFYRNIR